MQISELEVTNKYISIPRTGARSPSIFQRQSVKASVQYSRDPKLARKTSPGFLVTSAGDIITILITITIHRVPLSFSPRQKGTPAPHRIRLPLAASPKSPNSPSHNVRRGGGGDMDVQLDQFFPPCLFVGCSKTWGYDKPENVGEGGVRARGAAPGRIE